MTETVGRRELNKTRTREAIVGALRELTDRYPLSQITVDQLAEQAGISRRTFFNYYGSIPAVLSEVFAGFAAQMVGRVDLDRLRADPVEALRALVSSEGIPEEFIRWLAALNCHAERNETSVLIERAVWMDLAAWLEGVLREQFPEETDPLYISTLASGVMGTFSAAEQAWLKDLHPAGTASPAAVRAFNDHLDRSLSYLSQGWRPNP